MLASRDGSLWIGTEGGGLTRTRTAEFRSYTRKPGLSDGFVRALYEDRGGTIWVGTDNGLLRFADGRLVRVDGIWQCPALAVHDHCGRSRGASMGRRFGASCGSMRARCENTHLQGGASQNRVKSILETRDGTDMGRHSLRPHRMRQGAHSFERVAGITRTVRVLRQTSDGTLWVGTIGQGISSRGGPDSPPSLRLTRCPATRCSTCSKTMSETFGSEPRRACCA